jgi:hypothetical protein
MPYSSHDVRARKRLERILLVGPPKSGKTCCSALTAPGPKYIFNVDGKGGLDGAALQGAEFDADDITGFSSYTKAFAYLKANIKNYRTVIFDNVSTFAMVLEDEIRTKVRDDPRVIYPQLKRDLTRVIRDLISLPVNVIIIGHVDPGENAEKGGFDHMLSVSGGAKVTIPMLIQDWIWLEVSIDPTTHEVQREFLLAPQGTWKKAVRSIKDVEKMPADFSAFFDLIVAQSGQDVVGNASEAPTVEDEPVVDDEPYAGDLPLDDGVTGDLEAGLAALQASRDAEASQEPEFVTPFSTDAAENILMLDEEVETKNKAARWTPNGAAKKSAKPATRPTQRR